MEQLAMLGIEQARETYARHGADGELCALLYSDLRALHQRGGAGQELAEALGATASPDTRVLANMVVDPAVADPAAMVSHHVHDAVAAAQRTGKVVVDHARTACNTPVVTSHRSSGFAPQREYERHEEEIGQ